MWVAGTALRWGLEQHCGGNVSMQLRSAYSQGLAWPAIRLLSITKSDSGVICTCSISTCIVWQQQLSYQTSYLGASIVPQQQHVCD
jgi:hypothetical protein